MLSKKTFLEVIDLIKKQEKVHDEMSEAFSQICDGNGLLFTGSEYYYRAMLKLLIESMHDDCLIEWWLYEDVEKVIYIDGKKLKVPTADEFYDFMKNEYENKEG